MNQDGYYIELEQRLYKDIDMPFIMFHSWLPSRDVAELFDPLAPRILSFSETPLLSLLGMGQQELFPRETNVRLIEDRYYRDTWYNRAWMEIRYTFSDLIHWCKSWR